MPVVLDVVKSDAFLVENKDLASQFPINNSLSNLAFLHCNNYIKSELGPEASISFSEKPLNVWPLGNYHYVVNAEASISNDTAGMQTKKYVCRINYKKGDVQEGATEYDNWSIEGIDGIDS